MTQITVEEAALRLSELVRQAQSGEEIILTQDNGPAARLMPLPQGVTGRQFNTAAGQVWIADDFDALPEGFEEYA